MDSGRLQKERSFHDDRFKGNDDLRKAAKKYYTVNAGGWNKYVRIISQYCKDARVLEYGCGTGSGSIQWLKLGAILTGIDLSSEGIEKAKKQIADTEYEASYFVMDAENTEFAECHFDMIIGSGIIHHLDLEKSYGELNRILKKDGRAVFVEPLGHNPLINLYRNLTPKMRTEDEHPLLEKDLLLLEKYFHSVEIKYFSLFTLLAVPFRNTFLFNGLCSILGKIDQMVFLIPPARKYAWTVVIHASNPKK
ncbi:MAG: methyltransferase domain-containing protein [Candidatus Latescibacteria bacterium]|nr:methyltransferase domain-containing protein [Candidatus Latescibacterota bacterium]